VVFFSRLSGFFHDLSAEYKVQVYESMNDGSTRLMGENGKSMDDAILAKGIGLSGYVTRMKRAYWSNNVKRDPITAHSKRDDVVEAELAVPVMFNSSVIGTIHIQSTKKDRQFSEKDVAFINDALKELSAPVRNMHMYLMARQVVRELEQKLNQRELERSATPRHDIRTGAVDLGERLNVVAVSKSFLETMQLAKKLATQDFPVLLEGAHGVGKKLAYLFDRFAGSCRKTAVVDLNT
jgi:Nif-specific regulatory protein